MALARREVERGVVVVGPQRNVGALVDEQVDGGGVAATMADATGRALFARCGELGLAVGFMAFKGLAKHAAEIEALMRESPKTLTIIDHWGFPVQPATGEGAAGGCADDGASLATAPVALLLVALVAVGVAAHARAAIGGHGRRPAR